MAGRILSVKGIRVREVKPHTYKPCKHCGEAHHHFAKCRDGFRTNATAAPPFSSVDNPGSRKALVEAAAEPTKSAAEVARDDMREAISALPEGSQARKSLQLMLDRDIAREDHAKAEGILKAATGDPTAKMPVPVILRDKSEENGRTLNRELDMLFHREGRAPTQDNLRVEAQAVKDTFGSLPAKRDAEERAAKDLAKAPERIGGETMWECQNEACGPTGQRTKFRSLSIAQARRRAVDNPGWMMACPACGGRKVLALMEVA